MAAYRRAVDSIGGHFLGSEVEHIDRRTNEDADVLSRLGSQRRPVPTNVFLEELHSATVKPPTEEEIAHPDPASTIVAALRVIPEWTEPYLNFLTTGLLPESEVAARQVIRRAKAYTVINDELYKRSVIGIF